MIFNYYKAVQIGRRWQILLASAYMVLVYYDERDAHLVAGKVLGGVFPFVLLYSLCTHITYMFGLFLSVIYVWSFPFCYMCMDFSFRSLCVIFSYVL